MKPNGFALPIIILAIVGISVIGVGGYFLYQNQTKPTPIAISQPNLSPTVSTTKESTNSADMSTWKTYTNKEFGLSFMYPDNFRVNDSNKHDAYPDQITVEFYQTEGVSVRWLRVEKVEKKDIQHLLNLEIGRSYKDPTITELDIITTRKSNQKVAEIDSYTFETNQGWEIPGPLKKVIISRENSFYLITITYSNLSNYNLTPIGPDKDIDYVKIFDQILATFKFLP